MPKPTETYFRALSRTQASAKFRSWRPTIEIHLYETQPESEEPLERHYAPAEIAKLWGVSDDTIRTIFGDEPGVLLIGSNGTRRKRKYQLMRIPESVVLRVHTRLSAKPALVR